jgi:hypothetical protein
MNYQSQVVQTGVSSGNADAKLELYDLHPDMDGLEQTHLKEIQQSFESYLRGLKERRPGRQLNYIATCKIHPITDPVTLRTIPEKYRITTPQQAFLVRKGTSKSHRILTQDGSSLLWPINLISDEVQEPNVKPESSIFLRSFLDLYKKVMETGAQVQRLATELKIGDSTVHAWLNAEGKPGFVTPKVMTPKERQLDLEERQRSWGLAKHFRYWWLTSDLVPQNQKWRAFPFKKCPLCRHENIEEEKTTQKAIKKEIKGIKCFVASEELEAEEVTAHWCENCNKVTLDKVDTRYEIPYPWGKVRGYEALRDKAQQKKDKLVIPFCGL